MPSCGRLRPSIIRSKRCESELRTIISEKSLIMIFQMTYHMGDDM